ncbi:hypothetical protein F4678DRAFT_485539 [Xylaria arbuscula]|nr:hypothetical protein F4678DRAFT_485539 [Xylaria arbuscula]
MHVGRVMRAMCPKIESLLKLCKKHAPPLGANPIIKVLKNLSAYSVESLITEHLQSLEHDKTTLLLAIQLPVVPKSTTNSCLAKEIMPDQALQNNDKFDTKDVPWNAVQDTDSGPSLALVKRTDKVTQDYNNVSDYNEKKTLLHIA